MSGELGAKFESYGHEGKLYGSEEKHKADKRVCYAHEDLEELAPGEFQDSGLDDDENRHHQGQRHRHAPHLLLEEPQYSVVKDSIHGVIRDSEREASFREQGQGQYRYYWTN